MQNEREWGASELPDTVSRQVLDLTSEGIVFVHPSKGVVYSNAQARRFLSEPGNSELLDALLRFAREATEPIGKVAVHSRDTFQRSYRLYIMPEFPCPHDPEVKCRGVRIIDFTDFDDVREFKRGLIAYLSHEVRTPLASLTLSTRLLAKSAQTLDNSLLRASAETSVIDVDRLRKLVEDVLSIARFSLDKKSPKIMTEDLKELLGVVQNQLRRRFIGRRVSVRWGPRLDSLSQMPVSAERSKILWGLTNLLGVVADRAAEDSVVEMELEDSSTIRIAGELAPSSPREEWGPLVFPESDYGMGLTIARRVFREHGGDLRFSTSSEAFEDFRIFFTLHSMTS